MGNKRLVTNARRLLALVLGSLPHALETALRRRRNRHASLPVMSIGILSGASPFDLQDDERWPDPIISASDVSDARAAFVADPFAIQVEDHWYLFFEYMNRDSGKGEIGWAESDDLASWAYGGCALEEPFHLSYPAVYISDGSIWMVPETWESKQVRLYRSVSFPDQWELDRILLDDVAGTDPTLYKNGDGTWSMLLCSAESGHNRTLLRFVALEITGPWTADPSSPLVVDRADQARPGGHVFEWNGTRYRLGQDCSLRYGEALRAYSLEPPWTDTAGDVIVGTGSGWRGLGGHHADLHRFTSGELFAFVDGEAPGDYNPQR